MINLLIIADDITGALDTGVKFSAAGLSTRLIVDVDYDFSFMANEVGTLVLCVPTRHLEPMGAYQLVKKVVSRATEAGIQYILKKTDSALRGNVGSELSAVLDASNEKELCFIPALPAMNRITKEGIHYIDGVPVHESVFGEDPFEPVKESNVPMLLRAQCDSSIAIENCHSLPPFSTAKKRILVFDCGTQEEMEDLVKKILKKKRFHLFAGCAGLAESLASNLNCREIPQSSSARMVVLCGSVNPVSRKQIDFAEKKGFRRIHVPRAVLLDKNAFTSEAGDRFFDNLWEQYESCEKIILDTQRAEDGKMQEQPDNMTAEEMRQRIAERMGGILKRLIDRDAFSRFMIIGGDTLLAFLEDLGVQEMTPLYELQPGVVLNKINYRNRAYEIISKSGGFGTEDLLFKIWCQNTEYIGDNR